MKKVINGKRYDTDTAKLVGETHYSNTRDFNYWREELYQKRTGEFFISGEGGPNSRYSEPIDQNSWSGGYKIIPLTLKEAQQWAEEHLDGDEYEAIFGEVEEDKAQIATWISQSVKDDMDKLRAEKGLTLADIFEAGVNALK